MLVSVSLTGSTADSSVLFGHTGTRGVDDAHATYEATKRLFDFVISSFLLVTLSPVMLFVALGVKISSTGPVIFKQVRLTKSRKPFTMYKFRTMCQDAESKSGAVWASCNDPRVTSIGKFLRLTRLDELPQLFNVLTGEMSLIGPRPERPEFAEKLSSEFISFKRRTEVKAGITGLAQVSNGYADSVDSYRKKLALDILYVNHRSLLLDLKIAAKTILVVFTGAGAR
jgi:exopolysaccharide biosynthesis polyprenyl glycosylphosphotransferase